MDKKKLALLLFAAYKIGDYKGAVQLHMKHKKTTNALKKKNEILRMKVVCLADFVADCSSNPEEALEKFQSKKEFIDILEGSL